MCSITGFINFGRMLHPDVIADLARLLQASESRGRDGFGFKAFHHKGSVVGQKYLPKDGDLLRLPYGTYRELLTHSQDALVFLANHRAEPTTEFLPTKREEDQQPYMWDGVCAIHNGTIANDKEILKDEEPPTTVDSFALTVFAAHNDIRTIWGKVKGSFATLLFHTRPNGPNFHAVRNYKPLTILFLPAHQLWVFSSLANAAEFFTNPLVIPFPPYSIADEFTPEGVCNVETFTPANRDRAIVICSGGLDSVTVAKMAKNVYRHVTLLHFFYGCQAERKEAQAVRLVAKILGCEIQFIDAGWLKNLGGSSLTEDGAITDGVSGAEFAHEWVPARNTAMIGIAASYADRFDCGTICLGLNLEEGGAYPDNTVEFYENFNRVLDVGTQARPVIINPLANMTKKEIVAQAYQIGAPIHLAWSCYKGGAQHCGICGPCHMRRVAHKMLGREDTITYEHPMR